MENGGKKREKESQKKGAYCKSPTAVTVDFITRILQARPKGRRDKKGNH
jgi:hypothetical protein